MTAPLLLKSIMKSTRQSHCGYLYWAFVMSFNSVISSKFTCRMCISAENKCTWNHNYILHSKINCLFVCLFKIYCTVIVNDQSVLMWIKQKHLRDHLAPKSLRGWMILCFVAAKSGYSSFSYLAKCVPSTKLENFNVLKKALICIT